MNPALPGLAPFEMFDDVREIDGLGVDASFGQRVSQQPTGGPHERLALAVFGVSGLFTDEHDCGVARSGAKHRLRRAFPQVAPTAGPGVAFDRRKAKTNGTWPLCSRFRALSHVPIACRVSRAQPSV
jgi:hypothetical protein